MGTETTLSVETRHIGGLDLMRRLTCPSSLWPPLRCAARLACVCLSIGLPSSIHALRPSWAVSSDRHASLGIPTRPASPPVRCCTST
jgi:hypothetical protein